MMAHTLASWMLWTDLGVHPRQPGLKLTQVAPSDPPQTSVRGLGWWWWHDATRRLALHQPFHFLCLAAMCC